MKVLSLTHAHLTPDGLSPVSCERADSIVGTWAGHLGWEIDIVHTKDTKWRGIWPNGRGLKVNVINEPASPGLMMGPRELFSVTFSKLLAKRLFLSLAVLIVHRIIKRSLVALAAKGMGLPYELVNARKWGKHLSALPALNEKKYDFIFVCVGHGDEYLLQTALTISEKFDVPMIVDFRDLWSEHHEASRFDDHQRKLIRMHEVRLLCKTLLISVPQKPMAEKLEQYLKIPIHITSHSAYLEPEWEDGTLTTDEFRMLYAGKIYPGNPGLDMLLEMLQKLSAQPSLKPVKCHFYVDDVAYIRQLATKYGIEGNIELNDWVTPAAIWKAMRSAHLLLIFDGGFFRGMPLMMTKTYQYARTGRPILVLSKYGNTSYETFFKEYDAGSIFQSVGDALVWINKLTANREQYLHLPELRKVPERKRVAIEFGNAVENLLKGKLYR